ncbi:tRNA (adenosine(37)-N6)-threonylcarbamoyltransferase complex ATPase subunit type 1 TsaE [Flavobacteriaceae bacterium]|nr:tRNA (adenosine(37)-N6)-threonylcarbamoyltransferase complex ATPase subunit type 1 TsaE [Flavobacteriaceae bacterium]
MKITYGLEDLNQVAQTIIEKANSKILLFYGEMGVGKTTLIKEIFKELGVLDRVSSPTFSLVNEYEAKNQEIVYHFDFYRIEDEEEALDMGVDEYLYKDAWCLIEWPQNIKNLLPLEVCSIHITLQDDHLRKLQF